MKILRYIKVILLSIPVILYYHFRYTVRFLRHPEKYSLEYKYQILRKEIIFVMKRFKVDFKSLGQENILSEEKKLIICNHLSDMDPLFLIAMSEKPITFIAKKEAFSFPFIGKAARTIEAFPLDRQNLMKQIQQIKDVVSYLRDKSKPSVIVFIEGTRNRLPENPCLEFHPGTLKIAQKAECPIVLNAIYGTFRILDKRSYLKKYPIYSSYIKTLDVDYVKNMNTTEVAPMLEKEVNTEVDSLRSLDKKYILESNNSKRRKELETIVDARANS